MAILFWQWGRQSKLQCHVKQATGSLSLLSRTNRAASRLAAGLRADGLPKGR